MSFVSFIMDVLDLTEKQQYLEASKRLEDATTTEVNI